MAGFLGACLILFTVGYFCWYQGRLQEASIWVEEQARAQEAYEWAVANNRLPTVTYYVDPETGEIIDSA